jgi:NAD(P)-dependent dehydrogenase (short-subunit alcohol dehydrogenase family)
MRGRGGAIVNVASIMGFSGGLFPNVAYNTSKGGVVNLTRALAVEWAPLGIRVNAVAPTYVATDLTRGLLADPDATARVIDAMPMRRLATADEVAEAVLFLATPASAMTTGHTLPVDGGFLAV